MAQEQGLLNLIGMVDGFERKGAPLIIEGWVLDLGPLGLVRYIHLGGVLIWFFLSKFISLP